MARAARSMPRPDAIGPADTPGPSSSPGHADRPGAAPDKLLYICAEDGTHCCTLAVPPHSPWHDLLPDHQLVVVRRAAP